MTYWPVAALPPAASAKRNPLPQCRSAHIHNDFRRKSRYRGPGGYPKAAIGVIRDVRKDNTDEGIIESIKIQNRHVTAGLDWGGVTVKVRFRRRAKNDLEYHPVLESPLVQCPQYLGFGHTRKYYTGTAENCAHCGGGPRVPRVRKTPKWRAPQMC
ncbi:hypothetical protein EVAR_62929_1 [Eumeta japonica]|uniref:Uncharacterized protein n=1 Tax=Eumeta variegata TaxID=151549 RepID=A0A4C2AG13_EUMVA|nr:hypothetical protein EVAR_62929_1 [Eumeta japonica]